MNCTEWGPQPSPHEIILYPAIKSHGVSFCRAVTIKFTHGLGTMDEACTDILEVIQGLKGNTLKTFTAMQSLVHCHSK